MKYLIYIMLLLSCGCNSENYTEETVELNALKGVVITEKDRVFYEKLKTYEHAINEEQMVKLEQRLGKEKARKAILDLYDSPERANKLEQLKRKAELKRKIMGSDDMDMKTTNIKKWLDDPSFNLQVMRFDTIANQMVDIPIDSIDYYFNKKAH